MQKEKIVVTGIGVINAHAEGIDPFWDQIKNGVSAISKVERFNPEGLNCQIAAEVKDFDPSKYMDPKEAKRSDRYTHFALAASKLAVEDAGLDLVNADKDRIGVIIGSGVGGMETIETQSKVLFEKGPRRISPFMIPSLISNIASGIVAIELGLKGTNFGIVSACATGSHAIGEALLHLRNGNDDIILAGGTEAAITRLGFAGFCSMKAMASSYNDNPSQASRPFDAKRDGFVMGEGAGVLVLETLSHAKARGAKIYCELAGYGANSDAFHITSPDQEGNGLSSCIKRATRDAGLTTDDIDYINAHGTSTNYNDRFETLAIKKALGEEKARSIAVSSTKSMTGHLLGAAGGIEAAVCIKSIQESIIAPTINYENPDPNCDLDYVPNTARKADVNVAISNNLGFGGHNAVLLFKKL